MTIIKKISMTGFKSFGDRTVSIKLAPGFTCIVGPNGGGKSNVIDALCFCLGRLSKKTMRAESLKDLIFAGTQKEKPASTARVAITFDNSDGTFPGGGDTFEIAREVRKTTGSKYFINGKTETRTAVLNALAQANIDPDGSNQFVLQGKIVELTHMNSRDRRVFIETLIGLEKYDEMRDNTLKKLDKAERDLGKFEAIFSEVSSQLKKVEKEKNDALKWKELDEKINHYNAQLIALKISKLQKEEEQLEKDMEKTREIIEEYNGKIVRQEDIFKQEALIMENLQLAINEKEKEREEISEKITKIKTELSSNKTTMEIEKQNLEKLKEKKENLENQLRILEEGQTFDNLIEDLQKEISAVEIEIENSRKSFENSQLKQKEIEGEINEHAKIVANFKSEISNIKQNISSLKAEIGVLKKNIKRNKSKKVEFETELEKLKGEEEDIDKAVEKTKQEQQQIRDKITKIKEKIKDENKVQKDLETQITEIENQRNDVNKNISDLTSSLSSMNTEIKMNKNQINTLNNKKTEIEEEFKKLSEGKEIQERIKELMQNKDQYNKKIGDLKNQLLQEESTLKKNEQNFELLVMKKDTLESETSEYNTRISNIKTESRILQKNQKNYEREIKNLKLEITSLTDELTKTNSNIENLSKKKVNISKRINEMSKEKETLLDRIRVSEEDYETNKENIAGILQILNMLTQNINISVESIKTAIQESNSEAISASADDFKKYVYDIVDMMKSIEEISSEEKSSESMQNTLNSITQTLKLYTENADSSIEQLVFSVKESTDVAVQESTSNFDDFVQDLMEILENVYLALRKLTLSKSQDLYKELEEITDSINSQLSESNDIEQKLTIFNSKKDSYEQKLSDDKRKLDDFSSQTEEIVKKISQFKEEISEKNKLIDDKNQEKEQFRKEQDDIKEQKKQFWIKRKEIQKNIENTQKEFDNVQENLQDLKGIQNLLDNITEIEEDIKAIEVEIEEKNNEIIATNKSIETRKKELDTFQNKINEIKLEKDKFWGKTAELQKQIDVENQNLEQITDILRALQNVQRIIDSIEELKNENIESNNKIDLNKKKIEEHSVSQEEIQKKIDEEQIKIDELSNQKDTEFNKQKEIQKLLKDLNKNLQKQQKELNELFKNKEREQQIITLAEEIENSRQLIEQIEKDIEKINQSLTEVNKSKIEKQKEIDEIVGEKDESWKKQKEMQDVISSLKADLSKENSKLNNLESKKIITTDQIETLYERGKDYGALPPITEELSEEGLQADIIETQNAKKKLEPVNLKAINQYDDVKERFDEIDMRRQTIQRERKAILDSIDKIELEKTRNFMKAYHEINRQFSSVFQKLSPGGSAKMILERPDKPFEGGIDIEARPRGKKISSLEILSGGEKTLVALSFIFAVQEFYPAPFYIMDEIDAALDGPNVHRVSMVIKEFANQAQFLVISHREENIVNADRIYGVSMQGGITDVFSVDLEQEAKQILELEET